MFPCHSTNHPTTTTTATAFPAGSGGATMIRRLLSCSLLDFLLSFFRDTGIAFKFSTIVTYCGGPHLRTASLTYCNTFKNEENIKVFFFSLGCLERARNVNKHFIIMTWNKRVVYGLVSLMVQPEKSLNHNIFKTRNARAILESYSVNKRVIMRVDDFSSSSSP